MNSKLRNRENLKHEVKYVAIDKLKPNPKNPRLISEDELGKLVWSIKEYGLIQPIIVNEKTNLIIGGHQRWTAAKSLELETVPVIYVDFNNIEADACNLALNKISGEWDFTKLSEFFMTAEELQNNIYTTGFDSNEIQKIIEDNTQNPEFNPEKGFNEDEAVKAIKEPQTKHGDIYKLGQHVLVCGDALDKRQLRVLLGKTVKPKMLYTDPPYGLGGYAGRSGNFKPIKGDDGDCSKFYNQIPRNIPERYIWGNYKTLRFLEEEPRDVIIWRKNNFGLGKGYRGQYEMCFYYGFFDGSDSDVWDIAKDVNYEHPTQKPVELATRAINNSTIRKDVVLDIFAGSGSTLIACEQTDRKCYAMEIEPVYCDVIVNRFKDNFPSVEVTKCE